MSGPAFYPSAIRKITGVDGGSYLGGPPRVVIHTTETAGFYESKTFYHLQVRDMGDRVEARQYIPFTKASRALRNLPGGVETNRMGDVCINVSIVGYAKNSPNLSDRMIQWLGEFAAWCHTEWGVPLRAPKFHGGEAYGYNGVGRMGPQEWREFTGFCGHQDVNENTHWDPGKLPWDRIREVARAIVETRFADVPADHVFFDDVEWLADQGITRPQPDERGRAWFRPDDPVTRGQLAAFFRRALNLPAGDTVFEDTAGHLFEDDVAALAAAGITKGINPPANTRFGPDEYVTRGQVAAFFRRALDLPAVDTDRFRDDDTSIFEADIEAIAEAGITYGVNPPKNDLFDPDRHVTRGQLAAFLHRALR